jgi:hypothetical protein
VVESHGANTHTQGKDIAPPKMYKTLGWKQT